MVNNSPITFYLYDSFMLMAISKTRVCKTINSRVLLRGYKMFYTLYDKLSERKPLLAHNLSGFYTHKLKTKTFSLSTVYLCGIKFRLWKS